jgi:Xaa-Pro aminopeptidase
MCLSTLAIEKEPLQEYKMRRQRISAKAKDGIVLLFAAPEKDLVEYQQDPNFYYLTGFDEPDAVLLIEGAQNDFFLKPRNLSQERWTGVKLGPDSDTERALGVSRAIPLSSFPEILKKAASNKRIYTLKQDFDRVRDILPRARLEDIGPAIAELRQNEIRYGGRAAGKGDSDHHQSRGGCGEGYRTRRNGI